MKKETSNNSDKKAVIEQKSISIEKPNIEQKPKRNLFKIFRMFAITNKYTMIITIVFITLLAVFLFALFIESTAEISKALSKIPGIGRFFSGSNEVVARALARMTSWWEALMAFLKGPLAVIAIILLLAAILGIVYFSIKRLSKENSDFAIVFSTGATVILMIPMYLAINSLLASNWVLDQLNTRHETAILKQNMERDKAEHQKELAALTEQTRKLSGELSRERINRNALEDQITLLKHSQLSMLQFDKIVEVALLKAPIHQTLIHRDTISEVERHTQTTSRRGGFFWLKKIEETKELGSWQDETLIVDTIDLTARYGIDLKNGVRVNKISEDTIEVSGLHVKFFGGPDPNWQNQIMEVRTKWYDLNGQFYATTVYRPTDKIEGGANNGMAASELLKRSSENYRNNYFEKLEVSPENKYLKDSVMELAENFIRVMLSPLYNNIIFTDVSSNNSLPVFDFLSNEINVSQEALKTFVRQQEELDKIIEEAEQSIETVM